MSTRTTIVAVHATNFVGLSDNLRALGVSES
jgi:hypothetical protein